MVIAELVQKLHDRLFDEESGGYKILKDYRGTYIEKQVLNEEKMVFPIFRVFEAAKPERDRKLNIDPTHSFDWYSDSIMDYASIVGYKLNKPWDKYNRLISIQIPLCPNDCWHCYLPKELYVGKTAGNNDRHEAFDAKQIVCRFLKQRKTDSYHGKHSNILRITGGEPFLLPELLLECLKILAGKDRNCEDKDRNREDKDRNCEDKDLSNEVFVWTETNIEPFIGEPGQAFMDQQKNKDILKELGTYSNFLVHPCFHGLEEAEFSNITGLTQQSVSLDQQVKGLERLIDSGIDIYPTFGSNVCNPANVPDLFLKLKEIHTNLPLRVALIEYKCDYEPVSERVKSRVSKPSLYSKFANLRIWNELLLKNYGLGYGVVPRHLVPLKEVGEIKCLKENDLTEIKSVPEKIFFFKSSFRNQYHREVLDILAYPENHVIDVNYDKRHVQDDLYFHMSVLSSSYSKKKGLWIYADAERKNLTPIREVEVLNSKEAGGIISLKIKIGKYISFPESDNKILKERFTYALKHYFGSKNIPPGGKYMLLGESFFNTTEFEKNGISNVVSSQAFSVFEYKAELGNEIKQFHKIVPSLITDKKMKRSVFFRIELEDVKQLNKNGETLYEVKSGNSFSINFDYFLPNYSEFDENCPEERTISFDTSNNLIEAIGPTKIICSKYGSKQIYFKAKNVKNEAMVSITFWNEANEFSAPKITITIHVVPQTGKDAMYSFLMALFFTIGTSGIAMYSKAIEEKKTIWSSLFQSIKAFLWQSPQILVANFFYIFLLGLAFFGVSWFLAKGGKLIKL